MKRLFTLALLALALVGINRAQAQVLFSTDFETWSGSHHPLDWVGLKTNIDTTTGILIYTTDPHGGTKSCQLVNTTTSMKRFSTKQFNMTTGTAYEISFWAKGSGSIRTGVANGGTGSADYAYNAYYVLTSSPWTHYTDTVYGDIDTTMAEFLIGVKSTAAPDHIVVDDITITQIAATIPEVSIYDIQYTTNASGDSPQVNKVVKTGGIVTAIGDGGYFIQSHPGAWNGLKVYDGAHTPAIGDSVYLTGKVQEFYGLTELGNISGYNVKSTGNPLPGPETIVNIQSKTEDFESVFVKLENVQCVDTSVTFGGSTTFGIWAAWDGNDSAYVDDIIFHYMPVPGTHYDVQGVVTYDHAHFKVLPRDINDVTINTSSIEEQETSEMSVYPNPVSSELTINANVATDEVRVIDMTGRIAASIPTNGQSRLSIDFSNFSKGTYYVGLFNKGQAVAHKVVVK